MTFRALAFRRSFKRFECQPSAPTHDLIDSLFFSLGFDSIENVSSAIQTPRVLSKILRYEWYFRFSSRCLEMW